MKTDIFKKNKKKKIIYADPLWEYRESGVGQRGMSGLSYKTMSTEEICRLTVRQMVNQFYSSGERLEN